jgi:predicted component of type VI protein secretion system
VILPRQIKNIRNRKVANDSYQLVVRNAPQSGLIAGQVIALEDDVLTLGRDPLSDIILDDAEVSRHHAKLVRQADGYMIQDMGSTNGSFVDGERLGGEPLALKPGQVVMLGSNVTLVYQAIATADPMATIVAPAAAVQDEFPVVPELVEEVAEEVEIPMPATAPAEAELEADDELDVAADEVVEVIEEEDAEMATMMDESPFAAPLPEATPELEPLPEFSPATELPDEEPVFEPLPVPEPPAATFEELDERTFVDSAAPVSDFIEAPASPPPPPPDFDQPDEAKGGSNRNMIIIAVVVVLLICCCLAILAGVLAYQNL